MRFIEKCTRFVAEVKIFKFDLFTSLEKWESSKEPSKSSPRQISIKIFKFYKILHRSLHSIIKISFGSHLAC